MVAREPVTPAGFENFAASSYVDADDIGFIIDCSPKLSMWKPEKIKKNGLVSSLKAASNLLAQDLC